MDVDADRLTETLASRLAAIAPDGIHVRAVDGMLWYWADDGRFPGQLSNYDPGRAGTYVRDNLELSVSKASGLSNAWRACSSSAAAGLSMASAPMYRRSR
jgi:hypothetical protein